MSKEQPTPFSKEDLIPQEEKLAVLKKKGSLQIGVPKETIFQEKRVCLTPDAVEVIVNNGHQVLIEKGAGEGANYSDLEYSNAGAMLTPDTAKVFSQNIIIKIAPPTDKELKYIKSNSTLISALQLNTQKKDYFNHLSKKRINAIAFEYIKDSHNHFPLVRTLSEIAGTASILIASELLSSTNNGQGLIMGGISGVKPTQVLILGAGTVGEYATKSAIGLGASVKVFDSSVTKLRRLNSTLTQQVYTSTINPKELQKALKRCDVLIGALRGENYSRTPSVITENMVQEMKEGSVIIDVSIDFGGCVETSEITTHQFPTFTKHGVIHYGVTNIVSRVSRTATKSISNFFLPYLISMGEHGGIHELLRAKKGLKNGVYTYKGIHTNATVAKWFELKHHNINLLIF